MKAIELIIRGMPIVLSFVIMSLTMAPKNFSDALTSRLLTPVCYRYNHGHSQCAKDSDCCSGVCQQKAGQGSFCVHR